MDITTQISTALDTALSTINKSGGEWTISGAEPTTAHSNTADFVGSVKDAPDVIIKVCDEDDTYVKFAKAIYNGALSGSIYPEIYSITELEHKYVILIERVGAFADEHADLTDNEIWGGRDQAQWMLENGIPTMQEWVEACCESTFNGPHSEELRDFDEWRKACGLSNDIHAGNFGYRDEVTNLVLLDPVW